MTGERWGNDARNEERTNLKAGSGTRGGRRKRKERVKHWTEKKDCETKL